MTSGTKKDPIELSKNIQKLSFQNTEKQHYVEAVCVTDQNFHTMCQGEHESEIKFYERFQNQLKVHEETGASKLGEAEALWKNDPMFLDSDESAKKDPDDIAAAKKRGKEKCLAQQFFRKLNDEKHEQMKK